MPIVAVETAFVMAKYQVSGVPALHDIFTFKKIRLQSFSYLPRSKSW